jgi:DNA-binding MarR family transcriptional regulator
LPRTDVQLLARWYRATGSKPHEGDIAALRKITRHWLGHGGLPDECLQELVDEYRDTGSSLHDMAGRLTSPSGQVKEHLQILDSLALAERIAVAALFKDGQQIEIDEANLNDSQRSALRRYRRIEMAQARAAKPKKDKDGNEREKRTTSIPLFIDREPGLTELQKRFLAEVHYLETHGSCWKSDRAFAVDFRITEAAISQLVLRLKRRGYLRSKPKRLDARGRVLELQLDGFKFYPKNQDEDAPTGSDQEHVRGQHTPRKETTYGTKGDDLRDVSRHLTPRKVGDEVKLTQHPNLSATYADPFSAESEKSRKAEDNSNSRKDEAASRPVVIVSPALQPGAPPLDPDQPCTVRDPEADTKEEAQNPERNGSSNGSQDEVRKDKQHLAPGANGAPRHSAKEKEQKGTGESQKPTREIPGQRVYSSEANAPEAQPVTDDRTSRVIEFLCLAHKARFKEELPATANTLMTITRFCQQHESWNVPAICLVTIMAWDMIGKIAENGYEYPYCQHSRRPDHLFRFKPEKGYDAWDRVGSDVQAGTFPKRGLAWLVAHLQSCSGLPEETVESYFRSELDSDIQEAAPDPNLPDPEKVGSRSSDFTGFLRNRKGVPVAWMEKMLQVLVQNEDWSVERLTNDQRRFLIGYWRERVKYDGCFLYGSEKLEDHTRYLDEASDLAGPIVDQALAHVGKMFRAYRREISMNPLSHKVKVPHFVSNVLNDLADAGILKRVKSFSR